MLEIKRRTLAKADFIIGDYEADNEKIEKSKRVIKAVDNYLIDINKPVDFRSSNPGNILNQMDKAFENVCSSLEEAGVSSPHKLSTYKFYSKIEYFENKKPKQ
jgi:hypothetical protein